MLYIESSAICEKLKIGRDTTALELVFRVLQNERFRKCENSSRI